MKTERLVEYGVPIDSETMVTPPDVTELELEAGHPGEVARQPGLLGQAVEREALAHQHEVGLAGLGHDAADVGHRG